MKNQTSVISLAAAIALFSATNCFAQEKPQPADKRILLHNEAIGDPYLQNAFGNKKTSPAYQFKNRGTHKITTGSTIFTNQVNVDAGGQNIIGDAANEPSIAVNPLNTNEMVMGWRQFDNVASNFRQAGWGFTINGGQSWTFPGVIDSGIFRSDPVLDFDADGNFYYNSLTRDLITSVFTCKVYKSINGGAAWDNGTDAGGGDKQWMAIDRTTGVGRGNIYSAWSSYFSSCTPDFFVRSTDGNNTYEPCTTVDGDPALGTEAVGADGELYICGSDQVNGGIVVSKSLNAQIAGAAITWEPPVTVFMDGSIGGATINPVGLLGQANIDVDHSTGAGHGNVYVLAAIGRTSTLDPGDIMFARSTDGGLTWSAPIQINDDVSLTNTQWLGTLSVAPNGRIDIAWLDTRDDPSGMDSSALYYSYSSDQGTTWSVNEKLSGSFNPHVGYPNQDKMGDYFDMVSDNSGVHLAWANTLNGEQDVYYSHIVPPVATNVNSTDDIISIAVFPNPTSGVFVLMSEAKQFQFEIYNTLGEKVLSKKSFKTINDINLSAQPAGIYFLKVVMENGNTVVKKIIRE